MINVNLEVTLLTNVGIELRKNQCYGLSAIPVWSLFILANRKLIPTPAVTATRRIGLEDTLTIREKFRR
jgi:hypothetical protein